MLCAMINGLHALIYARDADAARAFFRDVLGFSHVDAGHGWLIFALPPAEVGIHPVMQGDDEHHRLYFMCDDIKKTIAQLDKHGVQCAPVQDAGFGLLTSFELPGGGPMGVYQPRHPIAAGMKPAAKPKRKAVAKRKPAPKRKAAVKRKPAPKRKAATKRKPARGRK